jgi:lysozyme
MKRVYSAIAQAVVAVGARRLVAGLAVSAAGLSAITVHEGNEPVPYLDIANVPTVCVGNITSVSRKDVGGPARSPAVCERLLKQDLAPVEASLKRSIKVPITQNQYDALADFTFNKGVAAFEGSTLLRKLNAGQCHEAAAEFLRWTKARVNGVLRDVQGLVRRARDQYNLFDPDCPT